MEKIELQIFDFEIEIKMHETEILRKQTEILKLRKALIQNGQAKSTISFTAKLEELSSENDESHNSEQKKELSHIATYETFQSLKGDQKTPIRKDVHRMVSLVEPSLVNKELTEQKDYQKGSKESKDSETYELMETGTKDENPKHRYYVVYNGPLAGIYNSWPEASRAVTGVPGVQHESFKMRTDAEGAFRKFQMPKLPDPTKTIQTLAEQIKDDSFRGKLKARQKRKSTIVTLGTIPEIQISSEFLNKERDELRKIKPEEWFFMNNTVRELTTELLADARFQSSDRQFPGFMHCKYNFTNGADAKLVYQAFLCGLIDNVYPSQDLRELVYLPEGLKQAVRDYKKIIKNKPVYLRFTSSILDWAEDGQELYPYHFIKMGIMSKRDSDSSRHVATRECNPGELHKERAFTLNSIFREVRRIEAESEVKINYTTDKVLMMSPTSKPISDKDAESVMKFEKSFLDGSIEVSATTKKIFCQIIREETDEHMCTYCLPTEAPQEKPEPSEDKIEESDSTSAEDMDEDSRNHVDV